MSTAPKYYMPEADGKEDVTSREIAALPNQAGGTELLPRL